MADVWDLAPPVPGGSIWDSAPALGRVPPTPKEAQDVAEAILYGLQNSATGLALRGKLPDQQLSEDAPWYMRAAAGAGGVVGDIPVMIPGAMAGAAAGAPGGPPGVAIGIGAGSFAAPMALREALVDAYTHNYGASWADIWEITKSAIVGGAKGAVIGGATMGAGRLAAPFGNVAKFGAELSTLTTTSAAVEGHLPTLQDFLDNAILLGGAKFAMRVASGLRRTYAETGRLPAEVAADAQKDPSITAALIAGEQPAVYSELALSERIAAAVDADPRPEAMRQVFSQVEPPKLGEPPLNDPIKYEYITDQDTLKGVLRQTETLYTREIQTQTRGTVTNKQTATEALKMVAAGDVVDHVVSAAENAAEIYARAHVLKGMTENAYRKLRAIADIPEAEMTPALKLQALAAVEQLSMTLAEFRGARAEAGRALQIFQKIKRDASLMGDAEAIAKLYEKKGSLQDIARAVRLYKDPAQLQAFAEKYTKATTLEKVLEAWKAGLVSGPQTHIANIMGNVGKWTVDVPESALAAAITAASRAMKGDPLSMAQFKARALAPLYGVQLGALDGLKVAGEVLRGQGEHLEKGDIYRTAIEGKTGEVVRIPFKLLQTEDAFFRTMAERAEAHIMAVDRLKAEKVHPDTAEYRDLLVKYTEHPDFMLEGKAAKDAIERVQQAGAEGVFSQRLGPKMETVQRALAGSPMQLVLPFFRTPANLLSWAVQHTPALNLLSGRWREDFAAGGERRAKALARVIVGTGIATAAYSLAQQGLITGGGLFDKEQGGTKRAAGWQPYSFLVGDKYYSYQRMEPVAKVVGIAADLIEMMQVSKDPQDLQKMGLMLALVFGNATVSTTYMSGLSNVMNGVQDPQRYAPALLEQYGRSLVPNVLGQIASTIDPDKREIDGVLDAMKSQTPFLREKLLPKRDVWGEPTKNDKWFEVMPIAVTEQSQDKVKTEAMRLQVAIADVPKYITERGPFKDKDKRVELTPEQRDIMKAVTGKTAMSILSPIVNAPDWSHIPDFAKAEIYKRVIEQSAKLGKLAAVPPDDPARVQMRQNIVDEVIRQTQNPESAGQAPKKPERTVR